MKPGFAVLAMAGVSVLAMPVLADDRDGRGRDFQAQLRGRNEVPLVLSAGRGSLQLHIDHAETSVHYVLQYDGLTATALFSHIHVAQPDVNGGVAVFLCGGNGTPACPATGGVVEGDFTAANVLALATQQLEAGNLAKLIAAIRAGKTYANLHTAQSPGGEIRGQVQRAHHDDD